MNEEEIIVKAFHRSCVFLGLEDEKIFNSCGLNMITDIKEREMAKRDISLKIILIYRNLTTILSDSNKLWLNSHNLYFNAKPIDVIYLGELDRVVNYLENALEI